MGSQLVRRRRLWLASGVVSLAAGLGACRTKPGPERELSTSVAALTPSPAVAARPGARVDATSATHERLASAPLEANRVCPDVERQARELGAALPRALDADTIATGVTARGCDLTLEYQLVTLSAQDVEERGLLAMRARVVDQLCDDAGALSVMQRGGRFTNVYYDGAHTRIGLFTVAADDCGI
jgi:hypothetical protein